MFRKINTYLIKNKFIDGNIIDLELGLEIIVFLAMNLKHIIYSIDPSINNINYIQQRQ